MRGKCGIIQIPRPQGCHLAKPVNTAGWRSQLGRAGAASSCRCDMRPLSVSEPLLNTSALRLWTGASAEEREDCECETKQGQPRPRRTPMHTEFHLQLRVEARLAFTKKPHTILHRPAAKLWAPG